MPDQASFPADNYRRLGYKTFWLFVFERCTAAMAAVLVAVGAFLLWSWPGLPKDYQIIGKLSLPVQEIVREIALWASAVFAVSLVAAFAVGWLVYANYKFALGEDALKIKRGILNKEEIAIPYRQIQDVTIRRDLGYMALGLSKLVILTAGREETGESGDSEGILPALDKDEAEKMQGELLKKANVEKVTPA